MCDIQTWNPGILQSKRAERKKHLCIRARNSKQDALGQEHSCCFGGSEPCLDCCSQGGRSQLAGVSLCPEARVNLEHRLGQKWETPLGGENNRPQREAVGSSTPSDEGVMRDPPTAVENRPAQQHNVQQQLKQLSAVAVPEQLVGIMPFIGSLTTDGDKALSTVPIVLQLLLRDHHSDLNR
ncbi:unnamed protein product [Natator depressus]